MKRPSKNYREGKTPPDQETFEGFAFCFKQPARDRDGKAVGNRIFPGDDTPRTFIECNMVNCSWPPGSTLTRCNTTVVALQQPRPASAEEEFDDVIYGRTNPGTRKVEYKPSPQRVPYTKSVTRG